MKKIIRLTESDLSRIVRRVINESVDRKQDYLDSIIGYLVDDTLIDHENKSIAHPWWPLGSAPVLYDEPNSFFNFPPTSTLFQRFYSYCGDTYGLTDEDEINYVWDVYINTLVDKINYEKRLEKK